MKPEIKAKWITALRGGEYQQTKGALRDARGFCCLGVLCDLYGEEKGVEWAPSDVFHEQASFLGAETLLPEPVQIWADLDNYDPMVGLLPDTESLSSLNDCGCSFNEIADLIERDL